MTKKEQVISLSEKHIKDVPGFPKPGIIFKDIVPVFEDPEYLQLVFDVMVDELKEQNIQFDKIVCPEARGFLFGPTLGLLTKKGVVMARKPGKLPRPGNCVSYNLEYGTATLVISEDSIKQSIDITHYISTLCAENRIRNAEMVGNMCIIPIDAEKRNLRRTHLFINTPYTSGQQ